MKRLGKGYQAAAAGLVLCGSGPAWAASVFSVDLDFVFDAATTSQAFALDLELPDVTGQVVVDAGLSTPSGDDLLATPGAGLESLNILVDAGVDGLIPLDESLDTRLPAGPVVTFDAGGNVSGIDFIIDLDDAQASLSGNAFAGGAEIFDIDGSGTVLFGTPVVLAAAEPPPPPVPVEAPPSLEERLPDLPDDGTPETSDDPPDVEVVILPPGVEDRLPDLPVDPADGPLEIDPDLEAPVLTPGSAPPSSTAVPSPSAAAAGLVLLGGLAARRRRS